MRHPTRTKDDPQLRRAKAPSLAADTFAADGALPPLLAVDRTEFLVVTNRRGSWQARAGRTARRLVSCCGSAPRCHPSRASSMPALTLTVYVRERVLASRSGVTIL